MISSDLVGSFVGFKRKFTFITSITWADRKQHIISTKLSIYIYYFQMKKGV